MTCPVPLTRECGWAYPRRDVSFVLGRVHVAGVVERLMLATLQIFGERDEAARARAISETYTEDVTFSDEEGVIVGRVALN